uniref:Phospholipid scramblase n=1 Tax=Caenorhabditis tropicalis TaxID=1561998 RepID=A0A1I7UT00_9PELO
MNNTIDYCSDADCEQNPRAANLQEFLMENDLYFGEITRWNGEHATTEKDREIMGRPDGEIVVEPSGTFWDLLEPSGFSCNLLEPYPLYSQIHSRHVHGFTSMCGMELNEDVVSSNIFSNVDTVGPKNDIFSYSDYESLNIHKTSSIIDPDHGLELFVSWDPWGCCSACCCPPAICGHDYQTETECDLVYSSRSRVGHLSIRRAHKPKKHQNQYFIELGKMLSIPPYTSKGIPVFSTLLKRVEFKGAIKEIKEKMIPAFLTKNNATDYSFSSGMFIDSESCKSHIQKTNCFEWSKCHNISLTETMTESSEIARDSCHQVHFVDVLVGTENMKVTVGEHQNLRIRIDSEVYDMKTTKAQWRVNLRKPKKYDKSRPCLVQGIVQRADEILVLNFATWDLKIDLILGARKVRITFLNSKFARISLGSAH